VTEGPCALQMLPLVAMVTWPHTRVLWERGFSEKSAAGSRK